MGIGGAHPRSAVPNRESDVITVTRETDASPRDVWDVISDGWSYAGWVVGASRIRAVEGHWPAKGSRIHHSVGAWPVLLGDESVVLESEPAALIRLSARARPVGEAWVEILLLPHGRGTRIEMREDVRRGPVTLVPAMVRQLGIAPRNRETLRRLALLAERNAHPDQTSTLQ